MITAVIILGAITLLCYMYHISEAKRRHLLLSKFNGPRKLPIFGNALDFKNSADDVFPRLNMLHSIYGDIVYVRLGLFIHALLVKDLKSFEFFLSHNKQIDKGREYVILQRWLGLGLLTSTGSKWRSHRKMLTPTFHFKILEDFIDIFNTKGEIMVKRLENEIGKETFDVYPYVTACTLDIICETAMGVSLNAQINDQSDYVKSVKDMLKIVFSRNRSVLLLYEPTYKLTKTYQHEKKCLKVLHGFTEKIIAKKSEELRNKQTGEEKDEFGVKKKSIFLDLLLQMKDAEGKRALSDQEIREEVDTFMFEGHDTTGAAISFILYNLANNPEAQENAIKELDTIFENDRSRVATYNDLQEMKYLECVIKESLRIHPSVPFISRQTNEDVDFFGKTIPKNTTINILIYAIQRDKRYFPDPMKFKPERFLDMEKENPYIYVPFSAGPRNCIGQKFAMLEMKATVSKVLRKFELLPAVPNPELILIADGVLKSINGINISLKLRKT